VTNSATPGPIEIARAVLALLDGHDPRIAALATVIRRSGSAPQVAGAKMLRYGDGTTLGTVGGGAIEAQVLDACVATLREGTPRTVEAHLVRDLGMCCGGAMEVFVELLQAGPRIIVVGAGHVARAFVPLARGLGYRVVVVDDRDALLDHPELADVDCRCFDVDELDAAVPDLGARDEVLVVTRDHGRDERALAALLERPHAYIGMIGSRRKVHTILRRVLRRYDERGRARPDLSRLRAPVGLDLAGRTPPEIAVSIAAELIKLRHGGTGEQMSIVAEVLAELGVVAPPKA
jgi:xanthine dehydrogenase accessory factor